MLPSNRIVLNNKICFIFSLRIRYVVTEDIGYRDAPHLESEGGIYKRKQENTLATKKAI